MPRRSARAFLVAALLAFALSPMVARAQQQHHAANMTGMAGMGMSSSTDLQDPMSQEASGTAWLPASSPIYGRMFMFGPDMLMVHGDIHFRYTDVGSKRGDRRVDAPNWFMGMYSHPLGSRAQLGLRAMLSLDPLTEGGRGYPLLFQTGETWHHQPLHDRQHPHDLFDELSLTYSRMLGARTSGYVYLGYPGEPALGPPTYMHRLIAYDLADAPIGHHWQDATHITWGVATAGINLGSRVKLEGSWFNGREPDENRYLPDPLRLDSYSGRLSFNPSADHALQLSYGFVHNPEGDGVSQHRITASWLYNRPLGPDANLSTALTWGQNLLPDEGRTNSFIAEADYQRGRDTVFGRLERIQKSGHELVLPEALHTSKFGLGAYTVGYVRDLTYGTGIDTGLGAAITVNTKPVALDPLYGRGTPVSFQVFLRLRPSRMGGAAHGDGMHEAAETGALKVAATIQPQPPKAREKAALALTLTDAQGRPVEGATIRATVNMRTMDMGAAHPTFQDLGGGRYAGEVTFSMPGPWRLTLTIAAHGLPRTVVRTLDYEVER